ncbi:MAG: hypothetical protein ACYSTS_15810 [Planctomycetota bacterium]
MIKAEARRVIGQLEKDLSKKAETGLFRKAGMEECFDKLTMQNLSEAFLKFDKVRQINMLTVI